MATMFDKVKAQSDRPEVRERALELIRRRDGRIRLSILSPEEAHKAVAKSYGVDWNTYCVERRRAYFGTADEAVQDAVAERDAVVAFMRAVPRFVKFLSGSEVTLPIMYTIGMSPEAVQWTWDTAEQVCREHELPLRGLARWAKALNGGR